MVPHRRRGAATCNGAASTNHLQFVMAGRRPRLVHEGSPIIDEGEYPHAGVSGFHNRPSVATTTLSSSSSARIRDNNDHHHGARREQENGVLQNNVVSSLLSARGGGGAASNKKYKLQTKFVVGGGIDPPPHTASACFRHFSIDTTTPSSSCPGHDHHVQVATDNINNLLPTRVDGVATSNAYKLRTTLVVGGGGDSVENDDSDDKMMMDEDERDQHHGGRLRERHIDFMDGQHHPTSHDRGSGGRHSYDNAVENQQRMLQYPNEVNTDGIYNFASVNPMHDDEPTATHIPAPIYHMPPPSLSPLVVLDGANIAYNYSDCLNPIRESQIRQPDPRGIRIAIEYFLHHDCRVQAVVPVSWYRLKPRPADRHHLNNRSRGDSSDARMVTEEVEELRGLRREGFLVAVPPGDDDDAYALALARREDDRVLEQRMCARRRDDETIEMMEDDETSSSRHHLPLGGYVVSNDMFHDAIRRDDIGNHRQNQQLPLNARPVSLKGWLAKKRISYSFANVGTTSQSDDRIRLDFVPNPRSDLIEAIDACGRLKIGMR